MQKLVQLVDEIRLIEQVLTKIYSSMHVLVSICTIRKENGTPRESVLVDVDDIKC